MKHDLVHKHIERERYCFYIKNERVRLLLNVVLRITCLRSCTLLCFLMVFSFEYECWNTNTPVSVCRTLFTHNLINIFVCVVKNQQRPAFYGSAIAYEFDTKVSFTIIRLES